MNKKIIIVLTLICALFVLASCETSLSLTFNVETGDSINVTLDTSNNDYSLKADDATFNIEKNGKLVAKGIFLTEDMLAQYFSAVKDEEGVELIDSAENYIFYHINDEWDRILKIENSDTGIALVNLVSEDSAVECFDLLTITAE